MMTAKDFRAWIHSLSPKELSARGARGNIDRLRADTKPVSLPSPPSIYGGEPVTYIGGRFGHLYQGSKIIRERK